MVYFQCAPDGILGCGGWHWHRVGWLKVAVQTHGAETSAGRAHVEEHPLGHA